MWKVLLMMHFITFVYTNTDCSNDQCLSGHRPRHYICNGLSGEIMTVPCGPSHTDNTTVLTYVNDTIFSSPVVLQNSTQCLEFELTAFDDNTQISCTWYDFSLDDELVYDYELAIEYPPVLYYEAAKLPIAGTLHFIYKLTCPLHANPSPHCSWEISQCDYTYGAMEPISDSDYYFEVDDTMNCTLVIKRLQLGYTYFCFMCTATNNFGTSSTSIKIPPLNETSICQEQESILILSPLLSTTNNAIEIDEGMNLTLTCEIRGILGNNDSQYWQFTSINGTTNLTYDSDSREIDINSCSQTGTFTVTNISTNQSGNYTCVYVGSNLQPQIQIKVLASGKYCSSKLTNLRAYYFVESSSAQGQNLLVAIGVGLVGLSVFIMIVLAIVVVTIILWWKFYYRAKSQFKYQYHTLYEDEEEFDVFLSFAEEDRNDAEHVLKEQLENCGYTVCWHHDAFLPGYTIDDNMERFVYKSRYTIALISDAFLTSTFCLTELNITKRKMVEISRSNLIPVLMDENCKVPSEILALTYIDINDLCLIDRIKAKLGDPLKKTDKEYEDVL